MKILYSNIIGVFVFDEHIHVTDSVMFRTHEDYLNKARSESLLQSKYKHWTKPNEKQLRKIFVFFKNKDFFGSFHQMNIFVSKERIRESIKEDMLVIQAVNNIDDINKVINILAKRLRDWYELHNPEFSRSVFDHRKFCELILESDKKELLGKMGVRQSMGSDFSKVDLLPIQDLAKEIIVLYQLKEKQEGYLDTLMKKNYPNLQKAAGTIIGAKLIELSGSIKHLAEFPSSTIQILGAEKALFRHLKSGAKSPKYGVLHEHPDVMKAKQKDKGKIARKLAGKIAIAARVDYFRRK